MTESSSIFVVPDDFSSEWRDITLSVRRTHTVVYTAVRYGRRFLLKGLAQDEAGLTDYRLQQEREFQLGVVHVHPNIAATYGLEEIPGVGRCIVQEWIDGVTLGEWLKGRPSKTARTRVFNQLLDALEYLHGLQLVHHDLKADNIMITRNGGNVKLIDFGLSATDATLSPVPNDACTDIRSLGRLLPQLLPGQRLLARRCINGHYRNIGSLRRAAAIRRKCLISLPVVFSIALLIVSVVFFRLSLQQRHAEQQRYADMAALVDMYIADERDKIMVLVNRPDSFDTNSAAEMIAFADFINEFTAIRTRQWAIRDSLIAACPEDDMLRDWLFTHWNKEESRLETELSPQLYGKQKTR